MKTMFRGRLQRASFGFLFLTVITASAILPPAHEELPNLDRRPRVESAAAQTESPAAIARMKAGAPDVRVDSGERPHARWIRAERGFLTGSDGRGRGVSAAILAGFPTNEAHLPTKAFLKEHAALFGFGPETLDRARVKREFTTAHNGLKTVVWEQELEGIPIFESVFISHTTKRGELVSVSSQFVPDPTKAANTGLPSRVAGQNNPTIPARQAVALAARNIGEQLDDAGISSSTGASTNAEQKQQFEATPLAGPAEARLVWLPFAEDTIRLCWAVELSSRKRGEMYRFLVDVENGEVLVRQCLTEYISDASYRVFLSDSPSPFSPSCPTPCTTQPPVNAPVLVTLSALDTNASPNGWIDDGINETRGNNVDAHTDRDANNSPDLPRPQGSPFRTFDFTINLSLDPATYTNGAATDLFYWCNWMHDQLYGLGFTEAAGNFQNNNFGRGGFGNDALQADAQDGSGFNNANMSTPSDGSPPRMQMYLFNGPTPDRDGDFDHEIVLHEYTHGLSNRRVGGGVGLSSLQSRGMGEGWSDWYGLALLSEPGDDVNGVYAAGGYATYLLSGFTTNYYFGIRRYPYSTDLTKNPLTFRDIDPGQASPHTGVPRSSIIGNTADEVHNQGEVWCVALWEARANLITKYGHAVGNQLILRLVTDGMNLSPSNPNFLQARDGILQADVVLNGGANLPELWAAFAKRGMGYSATSPSSSTTIGVVEAYDIPDSLIATPGAGFTGIGPVGGPFSPNSTSFTLVNIGTNTVNWSGAPTAIWLTLSQSSGVIAPGGSNLVSVTVNPNANLLAAGVYNNTVRFTNVSSGVVHSRVFTLRVGQLDYFTELFDGGDNDLDNQTLTFTPDGSGSFYSVCREPTVTFPTDPTGGVNIAIGSHTFTTLTLTSTISIYGINASTIYLASEGHLTLLSGDSSGTVTLANHFSRPRVSASFAHIHPTENGGTVSWRQLSNRVAITFNRVVEYATTKTNNFQIELFYNGRIRLTHLQCATTTGLVGVSAGTGIPGDFLESNLSGYGPCALPFAVSGPTNAIEGAGVLTGLVNLFAPAATNVTVALASSDPTELTIPATVTVLAGMTTTNFDVTIVDDAELDGTQLANISATAAGYLPASSSVSVADNETAVLTWNVPATATEGVVSVPGSVWASAPPTANIAVSLSSSDTTEIQLPPTVLLLAGQTSAVFSVTIVNDTQIDGAQPVNLTAHVANWTDGLASVTVNDNEATNLVVLLPASAREGNGVLAGAGQVRIAGTLLTNFAVSLLSTDTAELIVPPTATILAGQTSAVFNLTIVDDAVIDSSQSVTVIASAPGFSSGSTNMIVTDDESPPEPFNPSPAHLATNVIQTSDLTWQSGAVLGEIITNEVYFGITPTPGPAELAGTTTNTTWVLPTLMPQTTYYWQIVARKAGVTPGPVWQFTTRGLDHFVWDAVSSPQYVSEPFAVQITAKDAFETTVSNFTSSVGLSAQSDTSGLGQLANFDDLPGNEIPVVAGYRGLTWSNFYFMNGGINYSNSGYVAGRVSPPNVVYNAYENPVSIISTGQFNFVSAYLTAAWNDNLQVQVKGYAGAVLVYSNTSTLSATAPTLINFNYLGVTKVDFISFGGTTHPGYVGSATPGSGYSGGGTHFVMDNVVIGGSAFPIPITPTNSGNFVNGTWTGSVTVLAPATNAVLRADDGSGHTGLSNPFTVVLRNDLAVAVQETPDPVSLGGNVTYTVNVTNIGPTAATGVVVTNLLSPGVTFVSATPSQGSVQVFGNVVVCNLLTLGGNTSASVTIVATTTSVGTLTNQTTVTRAEADAYLPNNAAVALTTVQVPAITINDVSVFEGNSGTANAVFTVSVSPAPAAAVTVNFTTATGSAISPADFSATNGILSFAIGQTNRSFAVAIVGDPFYELDETYSINLSGAVNATLADSVGLGTIRNNDAIPMLSIGDVTLTEGNSGTNTAVFPVTLSAASGLDVTFNYFTSDGNATSGSDYVARSGFLTIPAGSLSNGVAVTVYGDLAIESDEVFYVELTSAANVTLLQREGYGLILNDDGLPGELDHFVWSAVASPQYVGQPFPVTISAFDVFENPAVNFTNAASLTGLSSGGVTLTTNTILPSPIPNNSGAGSYTLGYSFTPTNNLTVTHVRSYFGTKVSIWTDAGVLLASQPVSGTVGVWTDTPLTSPLALTSGTTYRVAAYTAGGNYYWRADGANSFPNGSIIQGYDGTGDTFPTTIDTGAKWWAVDLRYTVGAAGSPHPITPTVTGPFVNGLWSGNITALAPTTNLVLRASDGNGHSGTSGALAVELRDDIGVSVTDLPDPVAVGANLTYAIAVTNTGPTTATGVMVTNQLPPGVTLVSVNPSQGTYTTNGLIVVCDLGSINGSTQATITILVTPTAPGIVTNRATVSRSGADSYAGNNVATNTTAVFVPAISINDVSAMELAGGITNAVFNISLSVASAQTITVNFATANGTALAGSDYTTTNGTLNFGPGQTNQTIVVRVLDDATAEPNEVFSVGLSGAVNATIAKATGVGTILDNDGPPEFQITALLTNNSKVVDHNTQTSDDRGGVAVSTSQVFVTGDSATARFSAGDLTGGVSLGVIRDGLCTDLRTETVYLLGNGSTPLPYGGGMVTTLIELNSATGVPSGVVLPLSQSFTMASGSGIFSGYGRVLVHNGTTVYDIYIPTGTVTIRGAMTPPNWYPSESWSVWGVAESISGQLYLAYRESGTQRIVRARIPDGQITVVATFSNLSDMASFVVSPSRNRWYFHYEGGGQFGGSSETLGYADAQFTFVNTNPPVITSQPASQLVALDGTAIFNATATGSAPLSYQWRKGGTNLVDGGRISGAVSNRLTLLNVQTNDAGLYSVAISNLYGWTISSNANLTVDVPLPPALPFNPVPTNFATGVSVHTLLSWNSSVLAFASPVGPDPVNPNLNGNWSYLKDGLPVTEAVWIAPLPAPAGNGMAAQIVNTLINFDDLTAPCNFGETQRLTDRYAPQGVNFAGPGGNDGGAIVNQCGSFSVSGFSPPNFLGFNNGGTLNGGGVPRGPETLLFSPPVSLVGMLVGSGSGVGQTLTVQAYNASDVLVGSTNVVLASVLAPLTISGGGITRVVVSTSASVFVIDDLSFDSGSTLATYAVYLGTNATMMSLIASNLTQTICDPGTLAFNTTYFWQVLASNSVGSVTGAVWQFTTTLDEVHFATANRSVSENGGLATITVTRDNPAGGALSIQYATTNGTAIAGADYTAVSGTLQFPAGVLSTNFQVPILDDATGEGVETVMLWLSQPATNVLLVAPSNAVLTIVDNDAVQVSLFADPAYVDTGTTTQGEVTNMFAALLTKGCQVRAFTGITPTAFSNALNGASILLIPDLEISDLAPALSAATKSVISNFVTSGGSLIINGQGDTRDENFINQVFGHSLVAASSSATTLLSGAAAGTAFAGGPASLPENNGTYEWLRSSLPAGSLSIYQDSGAVNTTVAVIPRGAGKIVFLAYDWYDAVPRGVQDGGWDEALRRALLEAIPVTGSQPVITNQPQNLTVFVGEPASFTVGAVGTPPLLYQWRKGSAPLVNETNATLTLVSVQTNAAGNYSVIVSNAAGFAISSNAVLTVLGLPPGITTPPTNQTVSVGSPVTFGVVASGTAPLRYQWRKENVAILGATNASYAMSGVQYSNAGSYSVVVSNAFGFTNSVSAALMVEPVNTNLSFYAFDTGWYDASGTHTAGNKNYICGDTFDSPYVPYRNWFAFNVPTLPGPVIAAQLRVNTYTIVSPSGSETLRLRHVSTPVTNLIAGGSGLVATYNDLADGVIYGSRSFATNEGNQFITMNLNADGIANLVAAAGRQFAIGGEIATLDGTAMNNEAIFWGSAGAATDVQMILTIGVNPAQLKFLAPELIAGSLRLRVSTVDGSPITPARASNIWVYASTNVARPLSNWTALAIAPVLTNGLLRLDGINPTNPPALFFRAIEGSWFVRPLRLYSPQLSGNTMTLRVGAGDGSPLTPIRAAKIHFYMSTNVALPFSSWPPLVGSPVLSNGVLQLSGLTLTNLPAVYFRAEETP